MFKRKIDVTKDTVLVGFSIDSYPAWLVTVRMNDGLLKQIQIECERLEDVLMVIRELGYVDSISHVLSIVRTTPLPDSPF